MKGARDWSKSSLLDPLLGMALLSSLELTELHVLGPELRILGMELLCQVPHLGLRDLLRRHGTR